MLEEIRFDWHDIHIIHVYSAVLNLVVNREVEHGSSTPLIMSSTGCLDHAATCPTSGISCTARQWIGFAAASLFHF